MTIQKTNGNQSELNLALLNHVEKLGDVSYQALFELFSDASDSLVKAHARFSKKMEYLTFTKQLQSTGRGHDRVFSLGAEAGKPKASSAWVYRPNARPKAGQKSASKTTSAAPDQAPAATQTVAQVVCQIATAPAINVMATDYPLYTSRLAPPVRPGALSHTSYATRGDYC